MGKDVNDGKRWMKHGKTQTCCLPPEKVVALKRTNFHKIGCYYFLACSAHGRFHCPGFMTWQCLASTAPLYVLSSVCKQGTRGVLHPSPHSSTARQHVPWWRLRTPESRCSFRDCTAQVAGLSSACDRCCTVCLVALADVSDASRWTASADCSLP